MRIRHASLVIDRLRWGPACESLFSAKNIFDSLGRPRGRSGESDCGDYKQTETIQIPKSAYASQYPGVDSALNL